MKIKKFEFNMFPVNCYVLSDETKEAVIIDAGCFYEEEKQALKRYIDSNSLTVKHLLNTHLHLDHIFGNPFLLQEYGLKAEANQADEFWLEQAPAQSHVPGHSPGSIVFYCKEAHCIFSGDVLFQGSIGRADLTGGNFDELREHICSRLFVLPPDTVVYPGHGDPTTVGAEKANNPFFR